jgi:delta 1-pyrroline-5-carboxylate dehydrogenase
MQPFYGELVEEIYLEDFDENSDEHRNKALSRLEVPQRKMAETVKKDVLKDLLLDSLRALGNSSHHLEISVQKLRENSAIIENRPRSVMERFKEWIIQLSNGKAKDIVYEVEFIDITTSAHTTRRIQFTSFIANLERKARLLAGVVNRQSSAYQKLKMADEEQLYTLLEKNLTDLIEIHKNLDALDTFFKSEVSRLSRDQIRGVKNELAAIKNNIHQASQRKHEYMAKREEIEQLRNLGITTAAQNPPVS